MKLAPLAHELTRRGTPHVIVHTGQHYDADMSDSFLASLTIPKPDFNLAVGSGSHAQQTAAVMQRFEPVCLETKPDIVLVYGDVNSTVAAALVAAKLGIRVGHVEAGLRSRDWAMPEEINRVVTDRLSDLLFTPSRDAGENLRAEGVPAERVHFVGNIMIDSLVALLPKARKQNGGAHEPYALVTLHRPANVDDPQRLRELLDALAELGHERKIVFPVHPRTRQRIDGLGLPLRELQLCEPLPYVEFLALQMRATATLTDSGGIQEESTYLGVPCVTMRHNTERPITVECGTNILVADDLAKLRGELAKILAGNAKRGSIPPLWDGRASQRIADIIVGAQLHCDASRTREL